MRFPDKHYRIIYADPPWQYRDTCNAGRRGAAHKYPVMTMDAIKRLPVGDLIDPAVGAALFLWSTPPMLPAALEVMAAWGFAYVTIAFHWVKTTRSATGGTWFMGMGHWTRANAEPCLLGVRLPRPPVISHSVRSLVISPVREHSRKPDAVRERIVQLLGDLPRIELFARDRGPGWDAWGLEADRFSAFADDGKDVQCITGDTVSPVNKGACDE